MSEKFARSGIARAMSAPSMPIHRESVAAYRVTEIFGMILPAKLPSSSPASSGLSLTA